MNALPSHARLYNPGFRPAYAYECGAHVAFRTMSGRCFLFDEQSQNLYRINRIGAFIWCSLADGKTVDVIVRDLSSDDDKSQNAAADCVRQALREWTSRGFLKSYRRTDAEGFRRTCRVLGRNFEVWFADETLELVGSALLQAHISQAVGQIVASLFVYSRPDGSISIETAEEPLQALPDARSLAPAVFASLMRLALMHSPSFPALHAASIRRADGSVVLLPAASGSGKSTLMAGLLAVGYDVLGDDTVVFERDSLSVSPLTPYLCVKSGSWNVVADRVPGFMELPSFVRADDVDARYLIAGRSGAGERRPAPVSAIVFPRYRPNIKARKARLDSVVAFQKLLPDLDPIGRRLECEDIDRLIEWLPRVECFTLRYGSLDDAIAMLSDILR
jgi:hypothetical protein